MTSLAARLPTALVLMAFAPARIRFAAVSVPAAWLILAAEVLVTAVVLVLAVREIHRFRSAPWLRPTGAAS